MFDKKLFKVAEFSFFQRFCSWLICQYRWNASDLKQLSSQIVFKVFVIEKTDDEAKTAKKDAWKASDVWQHVHESVARSCHQSAI